MMALPQTTWPVRAEAAYPGRTLTKFEIVDHEGA